MNVPQAEVCSHKSHLVRGDNICLTSFRFDFRLPDTYSDLQNCLGKKMQSPYEAKRCVFTELTNVKPGYFRYADYMFHYGNCVCLVGATC